MLFKNTKKQKKDVFQTEIHPKSDLGCPKTGTRVTRATAAAHIQGSNLTKTYENLIKTLSKLIKTLVKPIKTILNPIKTLLNSSKPC